MTFDSTRITAKPGEVFDVICRDGVKARVSAHGLGGGRPLLCMREGGVGGFLLPSDGRYSSQVDSSDDIIGYAPREEIRWVAERVGTGTLGGSFYSTRKGVFNAYPEECWKPVCVKITVLDDGDEATP